MNHYRTQKNRSEHEIIADLERLSQEGGFIYTLCGLVLSSLCMTPDEVADIDWSQRPNIQELSFLLGLMVRRPIRLTDPPSPERGNDQYSTAVGLLEELHLAHGFSSVEISSEAQKNLEKFSSEFGRYYDDWMDSGRGMIEPIFYGENGAYDFQYLEFAERRYRKDRDWLDSHLGTRFEEVLEIARQLKQLIVARINKSNNIESTYEEACLQYVEIFIFGPEDIHGSTSGAIDSFLRTFSITPGEVNQDLDTIGAYNAAHSHPIIRIEHDRYFLPIFFNLARSIYESPYYWISQDRKYKDAGLTNRGAATEEIAHNLLTQVFGENNVYRGVKIRNRKEDVTDIDVLAVEGSKAVIVQAKSKKLTVASKKGGGESLKSDFQDAIQDAYNQALVSRKALLEASNSFTVSGESINHVIRLVDDAYIICLTGDHYSAATMQLKSYLRKEEHDPHPIAMSVFDLDVVAFYLDDPYDLLYYLRQRSGLATNFVSDSEMSLLAFHLCHKLKPTNQFDVVHVDPRYLQYIDAHFPAAKGYFPKSSVASSMFQQWRNERFEELVNDVKMSDGPMRTDVVFFLYDLAGPRADNLLMAFDKVKRATLRDGEFHDAAILLSNNKGGITLVCYPNTSSNSEEQSFLERFQVLAMAQKHKSKTDEWLALASYSGSPRPFDELWYSKEPWQPDSLLDNLTKPLLDPRRVTALDGRNPGRNVLCPCGSGLKFKRCCGK